MWINPETLAVFTAHHEIRTAFPSVSFPSVMSEDDIAFVGLVPVTKTPQPAFNPVTQAVEQLPPTTDGDVWTQQWNVRPLPTEDVATNRAVARAAKWEAIKAERDRRKALGVKVGKHWYHSDADSRIQQISLFVMGASVPPIQWNTLTTTPSPVFVTMTQAIAAGIFQNTAASDAAIFAAAETHRIALEASPTPETYDFTGGWPASIEDAP